MASPTSSFFSQTLHAIADWKIDEISKLRIKIGEQKDLLLTSLDAELDKTKRLVMIRDRIEACHAIGAAKFEDLVLRTPYDADCPLFWPEYHNRLMSFIRQTHESTPEPTSTFDQWETTLLAHLDTMSARLKYASLHADMVDEWLRTDRVEPTFGGTKTLLHLKTAWPTKQRRNSDGDGKKMLFRQRISTTTPYISSWNMFSSARQLEATGK